MIDASRFISHSIVAAFAAAIGVARAEDPAAQFEREVRPILEENCFKCHGPDKQKGRLRLDPEDSR
jgi:hypothetical protein